MAVRRMPIGVDPMDDFVEPQGMSTSEMLRQKFGHDDSASVNEAVTQQLKELYRLNVKPLETAYHYDRYREKPIPDGEFDAKPLVLVLGQRSTGKSTFIRHFLGREFPGTKIGSDTSTDKFSVLCFDHQDQIIPGHLAAADDKLPFQALTHFGNNFLTKFQVAKTSADVLKDMWFVDTPGIVSGAKQRSRGYKYPDVVTWFAKKAARIVLLFDHAHLEINTEFEKVLKIVRVYPRKIRVVLNRASDLSESQLVRAYGSLMWNLCSVLQSPKEIKIYVSTFPELGNELPDHHKCNDMFLADSDELVTELQTLPREHAIEKMNAVRRRAVKVKLHARLMVALKERLPRFFGKKSAQMDVVDNMKEHLLEIAVTLQVPVDKIKYMDKRDNRDHLMVDNLARYRNNTKKTFDRIDAMVNLGIPKLLNELSGGQPGVDLDKELVKLGLKKKAKKKLSPRDKLNKTKSKSKGRKRANSGGSVASTMSMFSVSSVKSKMMGAGKVFSKIRRNSRNTYKSKAASVMSPGSIADDAVSTVSRAYSKKRQSGRGSVGNKSVNRQTYRNPMSGGMNGQSMVERSVVDDYDDHIDLFSVVSDETINKRPIQDDQRSRNQMRDRLKEKNRGKGSVNGGKSPSVASPSIVSPRSEGNGSWDRDSGDDWIVPLRARRKAADIFMQLRPPNGKLNGVQGMKAFSRFNVADHVMRQIWQLVDINGTNDIDEDQFALAVFLLKKASRREPLPRELPLELIPPNHRM